jgi:uncharacterized protein (DUF302 family)
LPLIGDSREKSMSCYLSRTVDAAFNEVVQRVTVALKEEGCGVLTDIDVQATLEVRVRLRRAVKRV